MKEDEAKNSAVPTGKVSKDSSERAAPSFTPGPWKAHTYHRNVMDDYGNSRWSGMVTSGEITVLSTSAFGVFGSTPNEAAANARLIAAAPAYTKRPEW